MLMPGRGLCFGALPAGSHLTGSVLQAAGRLLHQERSSGPARAGAGAYLHNISSWATSFSGARRPVASGQRNYSPFSVPNEIERAQRRFPARGFDRLCPPAPPREYFCLTRAPVVLSQAVNSGRLCVPFRTSAPAPPRPPTRLLAAAVQRYGAPPPAAAANHAAGAGAPPAPASLARPRPFRGGGDSGRGRDSRPIQRPLLFGATFRPRPACSCEREEARAGRERARPRPRRPAFFSASRSIAARWLPGPAARDSRYIHSHVSLAHTVRSPLRTTLSPAPTAPTHAPRPSRSGRAA